jgi:hypothetical protein
MRDAHAPLQTQANASRDIGILETLPQISFVLQAFSNRIGPDHSARPPFLDRGRPDKMIHAKRRPELLDIGELAAL